MLTMTMLLLSSFLVFFTSASTFFSCLFPEDELMESIESIFTPVKILF